MANQILSASIQGIEASRVLVQIDSSPGIHSLSIVGLADKAVQESQDRINAAIRNSGLSAPRSKNRRFTVNLAPADTKKEGAAFDLPIAIAYLLESRQLKAVPDNVLLAGELGLDGSLSRINGTVTIATTAKKLGCRQLIIPKDNATEAAFIKGLEVIGAQNLSQVTAHLNGDEIIKPIVVEEGSFQEKLVDDSFSHITGQETAKRALVIAAAGGHNVLMKGPPGSGKTLLAKAVASLMPRLSDGEMLEVAKIYSSVGLLAGSPCELARPFRSPHHTASPVAIVGGGTWPRPGEISLSHRGVLFLDELAEFPRNVLEALRQPLEEGLVTISRASGSMTMPAKFLFIAAMNPCPCGNWGDPRTVCTCPPQQVIRYRKKVSGPLLDRMDIQISVPREIVGQKQEAIGTDTSKLEQIRQSISSSRSMQSERLGPFGLVTNSEISHRNIEEVCQISPPALSLLKNMTNAKNLSMRAYHRIMKVARTIADLENTLNIKEAHVAEAATLRTDNNPQVS